MRIDTVHKAKGESIKYVMYLADNDNVATLLNGTNNEEGRVGYVAITRSCDLLILAVPNNFDNIRKLEEKGFIMWPG